MKQNKKIVMDTILKEQEKILKKLYIEKQDLELALEDKQAQIELQERILKTIKGE